MTEYIERDKALSMDLNGVVYKNGAVLVPWSAVKEAIESIPAADVRKNKKGTWIYFDGHWECSVCRHPRFHDLLLGVDASFCGCCGADLRGD